MDRQGAAESRSELEDRWRARLSDAKRGHDVASAQFRAAAAQHRALGLISSDGNLALHQALVAEAKARQEYIRILRIFTDLVVHGRVPDSE